MAVGGAVGGEKSLVSGQCQKSTVKKNAIYCVALFEMAGQKDALDDSLG